MGGYLPFGQGLLGQGNLVDGNNKSLSELYLAYSMVARGNATGEKGGAIPLKSSKEEGSRSGLMGARKGGKFRLWYGCKPMW